MISLYQLCSLSFDSDQKISLQCNTVKMWRWRNSQSFGCSASSFSLPTRADLTLAPLRKEAAGAASTAAQSMKDPVLIVALLSVKLCQMLCPGKIHMKNRNIECLLDVPNSNYTIFVHWNPLVTNSKWRAATMRPPRNPIAPLRITEKREDLHRNGEIQFVFRRSSWF